MKSTIEITVLKESLWTKFSTSIGLFDMFAESKIIFSLDGVEHTLPARETPYTFEVSPGTHTMTFTDHSAKRKKRHKAMSGALVGGILGGVTGMIGGAMTGSNVGLSSDNQVTLAPGSRLSLRCQATSKGEVSVTQTAYTTP